jgi:hypothetical protein
MKTSFKGKWGAALACALVTAGGSARAAEPAPDAASTPLVPLAAPAESGPALAPATDHPASVLSRLADDAHSSRITGAWTSLALGAGLTAWGTAEALSGDDEYATWWLLIGGASSLTSGLLAFFVLDDLEEFNAESGAGAPGYSRAGLEGAWRMKAQHARGRRHAGGVMSLSLGAIGIGAGSVLAAGVGDMSKTRRENWAISTLAVGGAFAISGVIALLRRTSMERGYEAAYPSASPTARLDVSVAPGANGASLMLSGQF